MTQVARVFSSSPTNKGSIACTNKKKWVESIALWKIQVQQSCEQFLESIQGYSQDSHTLRHLYGSYWDNTKIKQWSASLETWMQNKGILVGESKMFTSELLQLEHAEKLNTLATVSFVAWSNFSITISTESSMASFWKDKWIKGVQSLQSTKDSSRKQWRLLDYFLCQKMKNLVFKHLKH